MGSGVPLTLNLPPRTAFAVANKYAGASRYVERQSSQNDPLERRVGNLYKLLIPAHMTTDRLNLEFSTTTFHPRDDPRKVGIAIAEIQLTPGHAGFVSISKRVRVSRADCARNLFHSAARRVTVWISFGVGFASALLGIAFVITTRPLFAGFTPTLGWIVVALSALLLILMPVTRVFSAR